MERGITNKKVFTYVGTLLSGYATKIYGMWFTLLVIKYSDDNINVIFLNP